MLLIMLLGLLFWQLGEETSGYANIYDASQPLAEGLGAVLNHYVDDVDEQDLIDSAMQGMLGSLKEKDPYSTYLPPRDFDEFTTHTEGKFYGVGIHLEVQEGEIVIVSPIKESPAFNAGILAGDVIIKVDGKDITGLEIDEVVKRIKGPQHTKVTLTVRRKSESGDSRELAVEIERDEVTLSSIYGWSFEDGEWQQFLHGAPRIAYLRIGYFSQKTVSEFDEIFAQLREENAEGLVLDVRFNPGGPLDAAVELVDRFIDSGPIVSLKGRAFPMRVESASASSDDHLKIPLAIVINRGTASAAEIVAGSLQAHKRATLFGTRSFGKGSVQDVIPLGAGRGAIKLTTAYYYLPNNRLVHRRPDSKDWGVEPDIEVLFPRPTNTQTDSESESPSSGDQVDLPESRPATETRPFDREIDLSDASSIKDPQVRAAVEHLIARIQGRDKPTDDE
jgi:carboxyl-terminal processing protease